MFVVLDGTSYHDQPYIQRFDVKELLDFNLNRLPALMSRSFLISINCPVNRLPSTRMLTKKLEDQLLDATVAQQQGCC